MYYMVTYIVSHFYKDQMGHNLWDICTMLGPWLQLQHDKDSVSICHVGGLRQTVHIGAK